MYLFIDMLLKAVLPPILLNKLTDYHSFKLLSLLDGEQLLPFLLSKFGGDAHLGILAGRFLWVRHVYGWMKSMEYYYSYCYSKINFYLFQINYIFICLIIFFELF